MWKYGYNTIHRDNMVCVEEDEKNMSISAGLVKELRERTGAGMMDGPGSFTQLFNQTRRY